MNEKELKKFGDEIVERTLRELATMITTFVGTDKQNKEDVLKSVSSQPVIDYSIDYSEEKSHEPIGVGDDVIYCDGSSGGFQTVVLACWNEYGERYLRLSGGITCAERLCTPISSTRGQSNPRKIQEREGRMKCEHENNSVSGNIRRCERCGAFCWWVSDDYSA